MTYVIFYAVYKSYFFEEKWMFIPSIFNERSVVFNLIKGVIFFIVC